MIKEIFTLFDRYASLLEGEFYDQPTIQRAMQECLEIAEKLKELGYKIKAIFVQGSKKEIGQEGEKRLVVEQHRLLLLIPDPAANETPIGWRMAIAKIYSPPAAGEKESPGPVPPEVESLLALTTEVWKREWRFEEEERHALLEAVDRHWGSLTIEEPLLEVSLPTQGTLILMIRGTTIMAPALDDFAIFSFLVEKDLEFLNTLPDDFPLRGCGCEVSQHKEALEVWQNRNLR